MEQQGHDRKERGVFAPPQSDATTRILVDLRQPNGHVAYLHSGLGIGADPARINTIVEGAPLGVSTPAQDDLSTATKARSYGVAKRLVDVILGTIFLVISLPIILFAAACIRLESPGSPFFIQTRLGKCGKPFRIVKLRGMYIDARQRFPKLYDYSHNQDLDFHFHYKTDPRVTRAGKFIRRTSIDELPNFWNVLVGDMSMVGPRPEIPDILELYGSYREEYLSVKPGITCMSKCTGRDALTKRETIEYDLQYIRRRSFSYDFIVMWRTFRGVVLRRDVY